jgi:hypothetical protein
VGSGFTPTRAQLVNWQFCRNISGVILLYVGRGCSQQLTIIEYVVLLDIFKIILQFISSCSFEFRLLPMRRQLAPCIGPRQYHHPEFFLSLGQGDYKEEAVEKQEERKKGEGVSSKGKRKYRVGCRVSRRYSVRMSDGTL